MSDFKIVTAHHPYEAQREDEISFEQDEIIKVTDFSDPDWWVGKKKDGSLGFFPSNFVTLKDENEEPKEEQVEKPKDDVKVTEEEVELEAEAEKSKDEKAEEAKPEEKKVDQVIGMARVMEDYAMQEQGEISLHRGSIINVYEVIDNQWSRGELNGKVGKYPSKYVEDIDMPGRPDLGQQQQHSSESQKSPVDDDAPRGGFKLAAFGVKQGGIGSLLAGGFPGLKKTVGVKPEPTPAPPSAPTAASTVSIESTPTEPAPPAVPTVSKPTQDTETQKSLGKAIVLHPYDAESEDELSLLRGEYVQILDRNVDDGWWKGLNEKGQSGVFPCNFVRELEDELVAPPTPTRARRNIPSRPSSVQSPATARPISVQAPAQRPSSVSGAIAPKPVNAAQLASPSIAEEESKEEEDTLVQPVPVVEHSPLAVVEHSPPAVEQVQDPPTVEQILAPIAVEPVQAPPAVEKVSSPPVPERDISPVEQTQTPIVERVVSPPVPERIVSPPAAPERAASSPSVSERPSSVIEEIQPPVVPEKESSPTVAEPESPVKESLPERRTSEDINSPTVIEKEPLPNEEESVPREIQREEDSESAVSEKTRVEEEENTEKVEEKEEELKDATETPADEKNEFDIIPSGPKLTTPSRIRMGAGRARRSPQISQEPSQTEVLQKELAEEKETEKEEKPAGPSPPAKPVKPIFAKFPTPFAVGGDVLSKSHLKPTQTRRLWEEKPAAAVEDEAEEPPAVVRPSGVKNIASRFNFAGPPSSGGNEVLETKLKNHTKNEIEKVKKEYEQLLSEERERITRLEKIVQDLIDKVNVLEQQ